MGHNNPMLGEERCLAEKDLGVQIQMREVVTGEVVMRDKEDTKNLDQHQDSVLWTKTRNPIMQAPHQEAVSPQGFSIYQESFFIL